ncbi:hypothetical protein ACWC0C_05480 [Streptomyces sp. NPDC001709]
MQNQRALAAACAAVAVLGLAAPAAVANGMGNGGGPTDGNAGIGNGGGPSGNILDFDPGNGISGSVGNIGRDQVRGDDLGGSDDNGAFGHGDDSGSRGDDSRGRGDGGPRNIIATPTVLPGGGRLTVTVDGCPHGTMTSRAFPTTRLDTFHDDTSHAGTSIDRDARPGRYDLTVRCDGRTLIRPAAFTVLGGVQGGVGSRSAGATPADMAIGAGFVTFAVVGGGAYWLRRRHEKRI